MNIELYPKTERGTEILKDFDYQGTVKKIVLFRGNQPNYEVVCKSTFNPSRSNTIYVRLKDDPDFDFKLLTEK